MAVLTFEECWTYGFQITYENDEKVVLNHLLKLAGTIKNRNAAGLGSLAYVLSEGDESVLDNSKADQNIRLISGAITKPAEFWDWTRHQLLNDSQKKLVENSLHAFGKAEQPWDKAFTQAAAYLALTEKIPETKFGKLASAQTFPLWIAIDMHTRLGAAAITEAARQIEFDAQKALWLVFYLEGANCNEIESSPWWEREKGWRMRRLGLTMKEEERVYEELKPLLIELLKEETEKLRGKILGVALR